MTFLIQLMHGIFRAIKQTITISILQTRNLKKLSICVQNQRRCSCGYDQTLPYFIVLLYFSKQKLKVPVYLMSKQANVTILLVEIFRANCPFGYICVVKISIFGNSRLSRCKFQSSLGITSHLLCKVYNRKSRVSQQSFLLTLGKCFQSICWF